MDTLKVANAITKRLYPDTYGCAGQSAKDAATLMGVRQKVLEELDAAIAGGPPPVMLPSDLEQLGANLRSIVHLSTLLNKGEDDRLNVANIHTEARLALKILGNIRPPAPAAVPLGVLVIPDMPKSCKHCGGDAFEWFPHKRVASDVTDGRLRAHDVSCIFVLGCMDCSETLMVITADKVATMFATHPQPGSTTP